LALTAQVGGNWATASSHGSEQSTTKPSLGQFSVAPVVHSRLHRLAVSVAAGEAFFFDPQPTTASTLHITKPHSTVDRMVASFAAEVFPTDVPNKRKRISCFLCWSTEPSVARDDGANACAGRD
jgi:hypothetical protein